MYEATFVGGALDGQTRPLGASAARVIHVLTGKQERGWGVQGEEEPGGEHETYLMTALVDQAATYVLAVVSQTVVTTIEAVEA